MKKLPVGVALQLANFGRRSWIAIIGKHNAVPHEHLIIDLDSFADKGVRRNLAAATYDGAALNFNEGANARFVTDLATVNIDEALVKDNDVMAKDDRVGDRHGVLLGNGKLPIMHALFEQERRVGIAEFEPFQIVFEPLLKIDRCLKVQ